ncbi:MAG: IS21-like element helper ATPase IstB [Sedimenticola sp.]
MLVQQTREQLQQLKLLGMAVMYDEQRANVDLQSLAFDERFGMLVESEKNDRAKRRFERRLRAAKLKVQAWPEDVEYGAHRGLDRAVFTHLLTCDWIRNSLCTLITGPTGVGKTWLGCALGFQAIRKEFSVAYQRVPRLLEQLEIAYADGTLGKFRSRLAKTDLIILDDWGLSPMSTRGRAELLELIDDHADHGSILITSQLPVAQWHDYIGEPTIADAILDRLVSRSHHIQLRGDSMRKLQKPTVEGES